MQSIAYVNISLDGNVPEYMDGIYRIGSVISYDNNDSIIKDHQELVDNTEFNNADGNAKQEIVDYVALKLELNSDIINFVE